MLRVCVLLFASAFAAQAVTIIEVSGPPVPNDGIFIDSQYQEAVEFTVTETYQNVTISAFVWGFDTIPYNAYLTTRIGPGTDPFKDEVARWNGNTPKDPSGLVPIFTGLTLFPATFYLILSAESHPAGLWGFTDDPQITVAPGASTGVQRGHYDDGTPPEYPPAADFGQIQGPGRMIFSVESLQGAAIPEPSTLFAGFVGVVFVAAKYRKRHDCDGWGSRRSYSA